MAKILQFRDQFDAAGAAAKDRDMQLTRPQRLILRVSKGVSEHAVAIDSVDEAARFNRRMINACVRCVPKSLPTLPTARTSVS